LFELAHLNLRSFWEYLEVTGLISPETIAICLPTPQFSGWCGNVQLYQKGTVNYHKKSVANDMKLSSSTTEDVYLKWYQNKKKVPTCHKVTISCCLWSAGRFGDLKFAICTIEYGHAKQLSMSCIHGCSPSLIHFLSAILLTWRIGQDDFSEFNQQQTSRAPLDLSLRDSDWFRC
jgi:hypothetical protein